MTVAILAQVGGAIAQAVTTDSLAAADAGPYLYLTDFISASSLLAAWLLGHRRVRPTAGLAIVGGFVTGLVLARLNEQLGRVDARYPNMFVEVTTIDAAVHFSVVSAVFALTAWIAYVLEVAALRHTSPRDIY